MWVQPCFCLSFSPDDDLPFFFPHHSIRVGVKPLRAATCQFSHYKPGLWSLVFYDGNSFSSSFNDKYSENFWFEEVSHRQHTARAQLEDLMNYKRERRGDFYGNWGGIATKERLVCNYKICRMTCSKWAYMGKGSSFGRWKRISD